jgi:formamidopyrimidine-DNA glycosylase
MPEGPEVALTAEILDHYLVKKEITKMSVLSGKYSRKKGYLSEVPLPLKIIKIDSCGKFMWFELSQQHYISCTFGLTGYWSFEEQPHSRIRIDLKSKKIPHVFFNDMRNFGTIEYHQTGDKVVKKINSLRPDFLKDQFTLDTITKYKRKIVNVLMDQEALGSGIGNYLVAEILYRAKISPHQMCNKMTNTQIKKLEKSVRYIMKLAYKSNHTGYMMVLDKQFPDYIPKYNYHPKVVLKTKTFKFKVYLQKVDPKGNSVKAEKGLITGRTTHWVPAIQTTI